MRLASALAAMFVVWLCGGAGAAEPDYFRHLPYPTRLVPGVGRNTVRQEGDPHTPGYRRRVVHWWPRKGQDVVNVPPGAPLRVWARNKGQSDPEALIGVCRNWPASDPPTFKALLRRIRSDVRHL